MPSNKKSFKSGDYSQRRCDLVECKCMVGDPALGEDANAYYLTAYFNTKGHPDSYGDVPNNFNGQPVYDFSRFQKNPVYLLDHDNSGSKVMGSFVTFGEDAKGFQGKVKLMTNPCTAETQHAKQAIIEGHLRGNSIGGRWYFDNPNDPNQLTRAYIHEVSCVAVGADEDALTDSPRPKSAGQIDSPNSEKGSESNSQADEVKLYQLIKEIKSISGGKQ